MKNLKKTLAALLAVACLAATPALAAEAAFTDVPAGSEYAAAVAYVTEKGLMQGYGNGLFGVDDFVTYAQLDLVLRRYQGQEAHWSGEPSPTAPITRGQLALALAQAETLSGANGLAIAKQGMFSSGGTVTEPVAGEYDSTTNWLELERHGNTAHVGHANVLYQIPQNETGLPMVYLHGYGQSRMGWMTTPDGREGWSDLFLKKGHAAFLVDQPGRGEAGAATEMTMDGMLDAWAADSKEYKPGDQAWYTHFRIGRVAPEPL